MPGDAAGRGALEEIRRRYRADVGTSGASGSRRRHVWWGLTLIVAVASVVSTLRAARQLSHTFDEPHHLATGLAWWQDGSSRWWTENPPLPKAAIAAGPYLAGLRLAEPRKPGPWGAGMDLLYKDGQYDRWLFLARLGTLPFLLVTLGLTFLLAGGLQRPFAGFVATALVATYPPLLGHAGLATTDVAVVATSLLFLYAFDRWWQRRPDRGSWLRAALLGGALGAAMLCKLTAPLMCGVAALGWVAGLRLARRPAAQSEELDEKRAPVRPSSPLRAAVPRRVRQPVRWPNRRRERNRNRLSVLGALGTTLVVFAAAFVVTWAGYRFSIGRIDDLPAVGYLGTPILPPIAERPGWLRWLTSLTLPAPEVPHGYLFLKTHSDRGHLAYLFGRVSDHGFWSFYLVGLFFKSPLPFLIAAIFALMALVRLAGRAKLTQLGPAAGLAACAVILLSMASTVNIGVRHVLIVVPLVAIWIAVTADVFAQSASTHGPRALVLVGIVALVAGQGVVLERAQPQLIAYFNPFAGNEPGEILIDSDLDWGHDFLLLKRELAERRPESVRLALFGTVQPCGPDMPKLLPLVPRQPATGWIVISENYYRASDLLGLRRDPCDPASGYDFHEAPPDGFAWLRAHTPVARIGASLRVYHIEPSAIPATTVSASEAPSDGAKGGAGADGAGADGAGAVAGAGVADVQRTAAQKAEPQATKKRKRGTGR